jgi:hypothetical protein
MVEPVPKGTITVPPAPRSPQSPSDSIHCGGCGQKFSLHALRASRSSGAADKRVAVNVGKMPYVRFDLNGDAVLYTYVRRTLELVATLHAARLLDAGELVASHPRSFERGRVIEDLAHIADLAD